MCYSIFITLTTYTILTGGETKRLLDVRFLHWYTAISCCFRVRVRDDVISTVAHLVHLIAAYRHAPSSPKSISGREKNPEPVFIT